MRSNIRVSVCGIVLSLVVASCSGETKVNESANQNSDGSAANGSNTDAGTVVEVDKGISLAAIGSLQTAEDTSVSFPLNISTSTTGALQIEVLDNPRNGRVAIDQVNKSVVYTPDPDFFGRDGFEIRVTDGTSASVSRPVRIEVTPVDDAPVCVGLVFGAKGVTEIQSQLACQDIDSPSLTYRIQTSAQVGAVTLSGSSFFYRLAESQTATDRFSIVASAGDQTSEPVEIVIDPTVVGETPVARSFPVIGYEDAGSIQVQLSAETQNPGAGVVFELTSQPAHMNATFDLALGQVTLGAKNDHWYGRDSFKYRARSGDKWSPEATVSVTVNPVNDAPELQISGLTVNEDGVATAEIDEDAFLKFSFEASDIEGSVLAARVVTGNGPDNGSVTISQENSSVRYQPNTNFYGSDSFRLEVCEVGDNDVQKLCSTSREVKVTVRSVNDDPIANNISISVIEDATDKVCVSVRGQASDVEDNQNDLEITFNNNWKNYINAGLSLTTNDDTEKPLHVCFLPAANLDQGFSVENFFTVTDANGATASANLLVSIDAREDITEFDADSLTCTMNEDSTGACSVRASDGDGYLSITCGTPADGVCIVRNEEKKILDGWEIRGGKSGQSGTHTSRGFSITPPKDFNGTAYIDMTASGAGNSSATATLKVVVNDVLDPFSWQVFPASPIESDVKNIVLLKFRAESIDVSSVVYKDVTISTMGYNGCSRELSQPSESDPDHAILKVTCDQPAEVSYSVVAEGPLKSNPRQTISSTVFQGRVRFNAPVGGGSVCEVQGPSSEYFGRYFFRLPLVDRMADLKSDPKFLLLNHPIRFFRDSYEVAGIQERSPLAFEVYISLREVDQIFCEGKLRVDPPAGLTGEYFGAQAVECTRDFFTCKFLISKGGSP